MARRLSRERLAQYVADGLIDGNRKVITELAAHLIETRRTTEVDLIVRDIEYYLAQKGIVGATVISADQLTADVQKAIEKFIKDKTDAKQISLQTVVDPTVIGGVKIRLPDRELDRTIAHQLTILRTRFKKA